VRVVKSVGRRDVLGVPTFPLAGLIASDQEDRFALGIEHKQNPYVATRGSELLLGPERMRYCELPSFARSFFYAWASGGVPAPIELARELVLGVAEYACTLGFQPHADFEEARGHLGAWDGPGMIRFGCEGTPTFTEGPYDDPVAVLRTLEESVGVGNFHFTVSAGSNDGVSIA
jgi:hypothetical protein